MAAVIEARQKYRDGLIVLGEFLAILYAWMDETQEEDPPEEEQ